MIHEYFIDNQLYLTFLEIDEELIPKKDERVDKQELYKLVESQFRKLARKMHPDYGGTEKDFKFLLDCKTKLLSEKTSSSSVAFTFDESKFLSYDKNTLASKLGNQLFDLLVSWQDDLGLKAVHRPNSENDEYEWVFNIIGSEESLSLNVQNLNDDLAELSHELYKDDGLSVLVCLFAPSKVLSITPVAYDNSSMLSFNDKILIESSSATSISEYFSDKQNIINDLEKIKNKTFVSRNNKELKIKKSNEAIAKDKKVIQYLQNMKIFETNFDENAADFLDKL